MQLTSFHALSPRQQALWRVARRFLPRHSRFLFEGSMAVPGQLWYRERRLLYRTVLKVRPNVAFEIGTWKGGGSTLFITQALHDVGKGILHTIEQDAARSAAARSSYERHLKHLLPHVRFHAGSSLEVVPSLLEDIERCDLLFLDGAQDAEQTRRELDMFGSHLRAGSVLIAHDWNNEKMASVRPVIRSDPRFEIIDHLTGRGTVGMIVVRVLAG